VSFRGRVLITRTNSFSLRERWFPDSSPMDELSEGAGVREESDMKDTFGKRAGVTDTVHLLLLREVYQDNGKPRDPVRHTAGALGQGIQQVHHEAAVLQNFLQRHLRDTVGTPCDISQRPIGPHGIPSEYKELS